MGYSDSIAYGLITSVSNTVNVVDGEYNLLTTDIMGNSCPIIRIILMPESGEWMSRMRLRRIQECQKGSL